MRLIQYLETNHRRRVAATGQNDGTAHVLDGVTRTYDLAMESADRGIPLSQLVNDRISSEIVNLRELEEDQRLLSPVDHEDHARCLVSLTGLTHFGGAQSRDTMHALSGIQPVGMTDSMKMFRLGVEGGKPVGNTIGAEPEWAYKGDGRCLVRPGQDIIRPGFSLDGGEEAEIAALYVINGNGEPCRVGFCLGNEFSDHKLEKQNYLYLAHSKLRNCSIGPELRLGPLPPKVLGTVKVLREGKTVWSATMESGESNMVHAIANLEHHHFKYPLFRRPGDLHIHFLGASVLSFGSGIECRDGDSFDISAPEFGLPLRNTLRIEPGHTTSCSVRVL